MRLKRLQAQGFRSLAQLQIDFDNDLTIVVGENDAGKTSLIECLKVVTQGRSISLDDFPFNHNEIIITVEIDNFIFEKRYRKTNSNTIDEDPLQASPSQEYTIETLARLQPTNPNAEQEETHEFIKSTARIFGLTVRSNSVIANLRNQLLEKLSTGNNLVIHDATFPKFNSIQLDGRHFENVPAFFKEVFLKEKQTSIWQEQVNENTTIENFVKNHLEQYSDQVTEQIHNLGIIEKLQLFLPELTEVKVEPIFHARDLNMDAKVKFLENNNEISIDNKGDGTKRRMTMALLEFKKEQSKIPNDNQTIYLLDEPDTHLHVKAQLDLISTIEGFASLGDQVIMTTHSPFIVNAVKPSQVRLLKRHNGSSILKSLTSDPTHSSKVLRALGIENTHLFFSRKILIVEGETEEGFIPAQYLKQTGRTISSGLIKVINVHGVQNIIGFARAILELHDPQKIFILCDNDASPELQQLIEQLNIPQSHRYQIGAREFEDAFTSSALHRTWHQYHIDCNREPPEAWTIDAIEALKIQCTTDNHKFSKKLRSLNQGGKSMSKPIFGTSLGERAEIGELPQRLQELLNLLITE